MNTEHVGQENKLIDNQSQAFPGKHHQPKKELQGEDEIQGGGAKSPTKLFKCLKYHMSNKEKYTSTYRKSRKNLKELYKCMQKSDGKNTK